MKLYCKCVMLFTQWPASPIMLRCSNRPNQAPLGQWAGSAGTWAGGRFRTLSLFPSIARLKTESFRPIQGRDALLFCYATASRPSPSSQLPDTLPQVSALASFSLNKHTARHTSLL